MVASGGEGGAQERQRVMGQAAQRASGERYGGVAETHGDDGNRAVAGGAMAGWPPATRRGGGESCQEVAAWPRDSWRWWRQRAASGRSSG